MLRFTPGIECHTHEYIRTGHLDSKFGFDPDQLETPGMTLRAQTLGSGIGLLQRIGDRWHGAADPRREGTALALP